MQKDHQGSLITIEGIDGSGKSTLAKKLQYILSLHTSRSIITTREPGATSVGSFIRTLVQKSPTKLCPKTEFLLFSADRSQHFFEIVEPELEKGSIIISDRMNDSSLAYQGYGRSIDKQMIQAINRWSMNNHVPSCVIYLKIDNQTAFQRITARNEEFTNFEQETEDFWNKVIAGFEELFKNRNNIIIIDGTLPPEEIALEAFEKIKQFITL